MIHPQLKHPLPTLLAALLTTLLATTPTLLADPTATPPTTPNSPPTANAPATPDTPPSLPHLAATGQFTQVLSLLKANPDDSDIPAVSTLINELERYQQHDAKRLTERREAYEKSIEEMVAKTEEGELEDALISAVDAHSLAQSPEQMLADPRTELLVTRTETAAAQAEQDGDWIEALNLYRALDLLYDDMATYRHQVKRASAHLRVLRLYAPERLAKLYEARAERRGLDRTTALHLGDETWEDKLERIDPSMLRQSLAQAARRHVNNRGYTPLLQGAIEAMLTMTRTRGIEQAFPGLADADKLQRFRKEVSSLQRDLESRRNPLNYFDAVTIIDRVVAINTHTIELPEQVLVYELTEGAVETLDEFSAVIWPRLKSSFNRNTQGKFYGVGIQISIRDDRLLVVSPLEATPARRAGIRAGDIIATVNGEDTGIWTLDQAVREITGPEGTKVTLGIERVGERELLEFELNRAEIVIESIRGWQRSEGGGWDYTIDPASRIGYIRLSQFIPQSAGDLDHAINQIVDRHGSIEGLILDLRFNPGGLLSAAVEVADRFIDQGQIVSTVGARGDRTSQFRAKAHRTHRNFPMAVLINEGSASASEIVAGALQDYKRAIVIGTRSFGKGSVQDLFPLDGGRAYLKLTTQYYALPAGRIIHRDPEASLWGIEPDLIVAMSTQQVADAIEFRQDVDVLRSDEELEALQAPAPTAQTLLESGLDPQLEAATLVIKTQLLAQNVTLAHHN